MAACYYYYQYILCLVSERVTADLAETDCWAGCMTGRGSVAAATAAAAAAAAAADEMG